MCVLNCMILSFDVFAEVCQAHITFARQRVVHGESCRQIMVSLSAFGNLKIIPKQLLVIRMSAVLNNQFGTLHRAFAAQVGNTLFGDDDIDIVLGVVLMADKRNDGTDDTAFGNRGAGEDTDKGVAFKVAAAADTVHHACAADVGRVGIAVEVYLNGCVDGNYTQAANDFR